jgi:hypothetical protein
MHLHYNNRYIAKNYIQFRLAMPANDIATFNKAHPRLIAVSTRSKIGILQIMFPAPLEVILRQRNVRVPPIHSDPEAMRESGSQSRVDSSHLNSSLSPTLREFLKREKVKVGVGLSQKHS